MKSIMFYIGILFFSSCNNTGESKQVIPSASNEVELKSGQSAVEDNESMKDVVKVAIGSKDHTTLVAAIKQAELVDALSNAGPFTVFAPTNEAFAKLPAGTVESLMKEDKKPDLQNILQYHVMTSSLKSTFFKDGMSMGMVNGSSITFQVKDGKVMINNTATILASVPASNGTIHVIDAVLLPPSK